MPFGEALYTGVGARTGESGLKRSYMLSHEKEIERLSAPDPGELPDGLVAEIYGECRGDPSWILEKCKNVIMTIIAGDLSFDDPLEAWRAVLPEWLVSKFEKEMTREESEKILAMPGGFERLSRMWTLSGFLHWFEPEQRTWSWWNGELDGRNKVKITLIVDGFPFPYGALQWLLETAGADGVYLDSE